MLFRINLNENEQTGTNFHGTYSGPVLLKYALGMD